MKTYSASRLGRYAAAALLALLLIPVLSFSGRAEVPARNLTLMIYLCGSDLEGNLGSASAEIEEIKQACAGNPEVSVLVLGGGSKQWTGNYDPGELFLMEIGARGSRTLQRFPSESMGKPETLSRLLQMGPELRPAAHYALILWDHGAGPLEGVCFDDLYDRDSLTMGELQEALENSPFSEKNRLFWIGFDACLMSSVEVACVCAPYADYMIASQETEPVSGWNYRFLSAVGKETGAEEIGRNIVASYQDGKEETDMLTLALIRLDRMPALEAAVDAFFGKAGNMLTEDTFSFLSRSRLRTKGFGRASTDSDYDLADLGHLVEQTGSAGAEETRTVQEILAEAVLATTGNQPHAGGLSIYSPYYNTKMFSGKWQRNYTQLEILPSYHRYLNRYSTLWNSEQMADWSHLTGRASPPGADGSQTLELTLTEDQADHFATASCLILEDHGSETVYHNTYVLEDLQADGNTLKTEYGFESLYAVDENGVVETDPIPFTYREGYYLIHAVLQNDSTLVAEEFGSLESLPVTFQCVKNEETQTLEIVNVYASGEEGTLNFGRQSVNADPEKWPYIRFQGIPRSIVRDENGNLQPFLEWEMHSGIAISLDARDRDGNTVPYFEWRERCLSEGVFPAGLHYMEEADNRRPWTLRFLPRRSTGKNLMAQFVIRDTQGNSWGSELIPLDSPDVRGTAPVSSEKISYGAYSLQAVEARAIRNERFQGICLRMLAENGGTQDLSLGYVCPIVNGITLPGNVMSADRRLLPGEKGFFDVLIPLDEAALMADPVLRSVSILPTLLLGEGSDVSQNLDRLYVETELDLSAFTFREPDEGFLAESVLEEIRFRLLFLRETENGLQGRLWMKNESASGKRLSSLTCGEDPHPSFLVNGLILRNCESVPLLIDLAPGGECAFDLEIVPQADGTLVVADEQSDGSPQKLVQITVCGYPAFITEGIGRLEEYEAEAAYASFRLPRPIFLKKKPPLVYSMESSLKPADTAKRQEKPAQTAEPLPDGEREAEQEPAESAEDPYPFFRESVSVPLSPEQYAVTLTCPVSPEERETVTNVSVLLVFPRAFTEGIYDLQAMVLNAPRLEGNAVAMDFCGLLPSLSFADQFFPCVVEEGADGVHIELFNDILIAGIQGVPREERNQQIFAAHLTANLQEGTARFTDYQVERFLPSVQYDEVVVFYSFPITFVTLENGRIEPRQVEDLEARRPEGHHYTDAPDIRMRPAQELRPDVIFRIVHSDGSCTLTSLTWDQAVFRKTVPGQS